MRARAGLLLFLLALSLPAAAAVQVRDDQGRLVTLPAPARRIVSLAPNLTELLYAAGAGDRLVGTVAWSDWPPAARRVPRIGDASRIDRERVLALHPDLVLAWGGGNPPAEVAALERLGLPVFVSEPRRLADIPRTLRDLGRLADSGPVAAAAAADFTRRVAALRRTYSGRAPVRVFYQVAGNPLMTVGGSHMISAVIRLCGGRNVFAGLDELAPRVSVEAVLAAAPEAIVYPLYPGQDTAAVTARWHPWRDLPAVRNGDLFGIPADYINRQSPRILDGAERLCRDLDKVRRQRGGDAAR